MKVATFPGLKVIGASLSEPHINGTAVRDFYIYVVWWYVGHIYCELRHINCAIMRNIYVPALSVLVRMLCTCYGPRVFR